MHSLYLKVLLVGGLALLTHHAQHPLAYAFLIMTATTTRDPYFLTTALSLTASLLPFLDRIIDSQLQYLLPFLATLVLSLLLRNPAYHKEINLEWLLGLLLMSFSIVTLNTSPGVSAVLLIVLYLQLILLQVKSFQALHLVVWVMRAFLVVGGIASALVSMGHLAEDLIHANS